MSEDLILQLGHETLKTTALLATPMLAGALIIGLIISVLQAITQINEATLTFIPKMIIVALIFLLAAPWMLDVLNHFTVGLFENMADMVRIR
ncbi:MAG: flagellar biosynthetic protein FliQ [Bdellovibrionaceae bacterium]|nr:flagellar biosynthetic protein FliQ [Pseudobdellovibrionaceae bacterium]|tara:strand:+ start:2220 stop:2495 length:276 start_codon:yes stop_codon:yes gene_type:complete